MKIHLNQSVKIIGDSFPHFWRKEYESNIVPHKGDFIEDGLWKEPGEYQVLEVTINYEQNYCFVNIARYSDEIPEDRKSDFAHIAELHGWESSWRKLVQ